MDDRKRTKQLATVRQAGQMLEMSPHTMRAWIAERKIGVVRLGRSVRVPLAEIDRLIDGGTVPARRRNGGVTVSD